MKQRTLRAIDGLLREKGYDDFEVTHSSDDIEVTCYCAGADDEGEFRFAIAHWHVNKLKTGRWLIASWDEAGHQWKSDDFSAAFAKLNPQACYCFARSLETLAGDIKTYRSPVDAIRAQLP